MAIGKGINKYSAFKKQGPALALLESGSGSTPLRRVTMIWHRPRDFFESNEITDHHQSTGVSLWTETLRICRKRLAPVLARFAELFGSILEQDLDDGIDSTALTLTYGGSANA